jgi:hypothetical protein
MAENSELSERQKLKVCIRITHTIIPDTCNLICMTVTFLPCHCRRLREP